MRAEASLWQGRDLGNVARLMRQSGDRLENGYGGPETQGVQKQIVRRLDEMIKKLEEESQKKQDEQQQSSGQQQQQPQRPADPAQDSEIKRDGGEGVVQTAKLRKLQESWGQLPERDRTRLLQDLVQDMSPTHREAVENYFRNLTRRRQ